MIAEGNEHLEEATHELFPSVRRWVNRVSTSKSIWTPSVNEARHDEQGLDVYDTALALASAFSTRLTNR
jgi:hypothetical protein